jgi:hypothetical protein
MRKIFKYSIIAAVTGLTACTEDFLTQEIRGKQTLDTYYSSKEEVSAQIYGCYQAIAFDDWWQIYNTYVLADMCTDDSWMNNTTQSQDGYEDLVLFRGETTSGTLSNFWTHRYKGIYRCNTVLENIDKVKAYTEEERNRYKAEVKFLRAYFYFELAKNFGGVPSILSVVNIGDQVSMKRMTLDETYTLIEKELLESANYLPLRSETIKENKLGSVTKGAAMSLLAKTYLYHEKYPEAEKYLDEVIGSNEYALLDDFSKVWNMDYNNSEEGIFEIQTSDNISYSAGERISVVVGSRDDSGWSWSGPSSDLENAYIAEGDEIRLFNTIIKHGASEVPNETQMDNFEYTDTDKDGNPIKVKGKYPILPSKHKSGRVNAKLYIPLAKRPSPYDAAHIPLNYKLIRYADVLLMAAEVKNQLGKDEEAQKFLNQVRERVKLDPVTSTGNDLKKAIRKERRLELAMEGNRLYDIRRWTDDNGKKVACNLFGPDGSWVRYNTKESTDEFETTNLKEPQDEGINFNENRDLLFPIPSVEVNKSNGELEQNPGY